MRLTIAETELLRGKEQRTAAALDAIKRDMEAASMNASTNHPHPAPQHCHPGWYSAFGEFGEVRDCLVSEYNEIHRRRKLHDKLVLPEPSGERSYVYTRLDAFGHAGSRTLVSVRTYLCRYYLWQHNERVMPWSVVLRPDRTLIRQITGKRHLRGPWRCFFFGAGKERAHAFEFSEWIIGPDGKRMRRPAEGAE